MSDHLYPGMAELLEEAARRHAGPLVYACEAIDLAHRAFIRQREFSARFVPGVPGSRRARNDVNDDAWRFFRSVADPLVASGLIRAFETVDGGEEVILADGLHLRLKKADKSGRTSNYPTKRIRQIGRSSSRLLFEEASLLDQAILAGTRLDLIYVASEVMGEYEYVALKLAVEPDSPVLVLEPPTDAVLARVSADAHSIVTETRRRLTA